MPVRAEPAVDTPFDAVAVDGAVVVMGRKVSEALTPKAALASAERIRVAVAEALEPPIASEDWDR